MQHEKDHTIEMPTKLHRNLALYLLLFMIIAVTVILWLNHGYAVALGFVVLELQLVLAFATLGTLTSVLSNIQKLLQLFIYGPDEGGLNRQKEPLFTDGITPSADLVEKVMGAEKESKGSL